MIPTEQDILTHLGTTYGGEWEMLPVSDRQPIMRSFVDRTWNRSLVERLDMIQSKGGRWKRWVDRQMEKSL